MCLGGSMLLIGRGLALILHRRECLLQQRSRLHWQVEGNGDRVTSSSSCVADLVESKGERWAIDTTFSIIMTPVLFRPPVLNLPPLLWNPPRAGCPPPYHPVPLPLPLLFPWQPLPFLE
jgi:hypothetical protein